MAIYSLSISTSRPPVASTLQSLVASGFALWEKNGGYRKYYKCSIVMC